jgi:hypothetical protein
MKRNSLISLCLVASMCAISLFSGCGNQSQQQKIINTVVNALYTCPNVAFSEAVAKESSATAKRVAGEVTTLTEENSPTLKYNSDTYKKYFSASAYELFLSKNYDFHYQLSSIEKKWSSKITKTTLKSEGTSKYSFICDIDVKDNSSNVTKQQVTGTIEFDESGKISWFKEYKPFLVK